MIIETLLVFAGAAAKPVYDKFIEPLVDADKALIRAECRVMFRKKLDALKKQRKAEKETEAKVVKRRVAPVHEAA